LKKRLTASGLFLEGRPAGWAEVYRVFRDCKFVEDEGNIVFYKNANGLAASRPVIPGDAASDSGIELEKWRIEQSRAHRTHFWIRDKQTLWAFWIGFYE
jgi:hypothetical protein